MVADNRRPQLLLGSLETVLLVLGLENGMIREEVGLGEGPVMRIVEFEFV